MRLALAAAVIVGGGASALAGPITYAYDDLGRLIAVIDEGGETAIYRYDAVGNLLSIARQPSSTVAVLDFQPKQGPVGTTVTLQGTGFSATPSQNTVTVNGASASVTSASTTELMVTVPAGATTGLIGVTAPGGSAQSATAFTVTATNGAPTITSFTPTVATAGTAVTVNGTNFEPLLANNKLGFNATRRTMATVSSATPTVLGTSVPSGSTSGRLSLVTPGGAAESAADFFIPPPPKTVADVVFTGRIAIGGANVGGTISPASKLGLIVFDGAVGQRLNFGVTGLTIYASNLTVYRPDGATLVTAPVSSTALTLDTPPLPQPGTYQLAFVPQSSYTGNFTLTLSEEVAGGTIEVNGTAVTATASRPGQNVRFSFAGTAGQRLSVGLTAVTLAGTNVLVVKPDGTTLASGPGNTNSAFDTPPLPVTGTYSLLVDQGLANTGSMTLTLSDEVTGTIEVGGASVPVSITRAGQRARLTLSGTAGQRLNLGLSNSSLTSATAFILNPDGTTLAGPGGFGTSAAALDTLPLPTTGTYAVLIDPGNVFTGSVTLTLSEEISGTITAGGPAVPLNIARLGQRARLTFDGTAGQRLSLGLTGITIASGSANVFKPDGALLWPATVNFGTAPTDLDTPTLLTTGTFTILVDPNNVNTGTITLTLSEDLPGALEVNGASANVTITRAGQRARSTFSGTAGQWLSVALTGSSLGSGTVYFLKPDGTTLISVGFSGPTGVLDSLPLPSAGTYAVLVDPNSAATGNVTLTLSAELNGAITIGGAAVPVSITRPGQRARITFSGTAGQRLSLGLTGSSFASATAIFLKPDGSALGSTLFFGTSATPGIDAPVLPSTGTYAILMDPASVNTGSVTLTLSEELNGPITPGGAAVPVAIERPAQRARLTFSGTAGQRVSVLLSSVTVTGGQLLVLNPSEGQVGSSLGFPTSTFLEPVTLAATGTHALLIDPFLDYTGGLTVNLYTVTDVTGSVTVNGPTQPVTITTPGQNAALDFTASSGLAVTARAANSTLGCFVLRIQDGAASSSTTITTASGTVTRTLTTAGPYSVKADPCGPNTGAVDLSVTNP